MTRLRDDGYLETDDPVVASCFLEQAVCQGSPSAYTYLLSAVSADTWSEMEWGYPILIPAATVAEVIKERSESPVFWDVLMWAVMDTEARESEEAPDMNSLYRWLRTHTGESGDMHDKPNNSRLATGPTHTGEGE